MPPLHRAKQIYQYTIICVSYHMRLLSIHNHMCFLSYALLSQDTTTRQIDRVQRRISEPYEHHCLKDNIEKKE